MATGNPRNKVALKPGFSLIGWVRVTNSGADLIGRKKGPVSYEELKKHDKIDDCWMSIRGKVYNVTRYMDYHPGGVEQLMRAAGKDATNYFDEYHAWVNIEQLLAKCYIGPLKNVVMLDLNHTSNSKKLTNLSPPSTTLMPPINENEKGNSAIMVPSQNSINPRFDWIQKRNELTIYFYLRRFCNPGIMIEQICDNVQRESKVTIFIGNIMYTYKFLFYKNLKWPPTKLKVNQETGKVEISYEKEETELWSSYGMHERITIEEREKYCEFTIIKKEPINHDSFKLILRPKNDKIIFFTSLGFHVDLKLSILGKDIVRSYTPVPPKHVSSHLNDLQHLNFLIKKYSSGNLSKYIYGSNINNSILVSHQLGSFELNTLKSHINIAIFAAGSGITPFCGLIDHLIERTDNKIETVVLYYFNKTKEDIWCHDLFNEMAEKDERLVIKYVLSELDKSWTGEYGRISEKVMVELTKFKITVALICGPVSFNAEALRILSAFPKIEAICFQG